MPSQRVNVRVPVTVTTQFALKTYVENEEDLKALKNRIWPLYLHVPILKKEPPQSQLPHLICPKTNLDGEVLLGICF